MEPRLTIVNADVVENDQTHRPRVRHPFNWLGRYLAPLAGAFMLYELFPMWESQPLVQSSDYLKVHIAGTVLFVCGAVLAFCIAVTAWQDHRERRRDLTS